MWQFVKLQNIMQNIFQIYLSLSLITLAIPSLVPVTPPPPQLIFLLVFSLYLFSPCDGLYLG